MALSHNAVGYECKEDFVPFDSVDALVIERDPDFVDYLFYHNVLDKFCWLIKLHYGDREMVKRKRYRIDTLFQRFLHVNRFRTRKAAKCISQRVSSEVLEHHLTKGWYNELVRNDPLHPEYLEVGTQLSAWDSPGSGGLAAWNIIQSYYAFLEYLTCICVAVSPSLDTRGHKKIANAFNNQVRGAARERIVFYPFDLSNDTPPRHIPEHPEFCGYQYATYPREPGVSIFDLEYQVQKAFRLQTDNKANSKATIFNLMYELRLWANYTGVQSLLKLSDGGYQQFLSRNLATLVFFAAGMAELTVISAIGVSEYLVMLKKFSDAYINKHERFARSKFLVPAYIRLRSYVHLNLIDGPIDFVLREPADPVRFIDI